MDKLQDQGSVRKIIRSVMDIREQKPKQKPVFLKISPDLNLSQIDEIISIYYEMKLDGLIATNTSSERGGLSTSITSIEKIGQGGLSGKP
jgi:dihydroorotate dehydrogenase